MSLVCVLIATAFIITEIDYKTYIFLLKESNSKILTSLRIAPMFTCVWGQLSEMIYKSDNILYSKASTCLKVHTFFPTDHKQ